MDSTLRSVHSLIPSSHDEAIRGSTRLALWSGCSSQVSALLAGAWLTSALRYIGCDLQIKTGKTNAGQNIMSTTSSVMGQSPVSGSLASASSSTYGDGCTVDISFSTFNQGVIHATEGSFGGSNLNSDFPTATEGAACTGTQTIKIRSTSSTPNGITWTAPSVASNSVTLSLAQASGYGTISRQSITLTKGACASAPTKAPTNPPTNVGQTWSPTSSPTSSPSASPTSDNSSAAQSSAPTVTKLMLYCIGYFVIQYVCTH